MYTGANFFLPSFLSFLPSSRIPTPTPSSSSLSNSLLLAGIPDNARCTSGPMQTRPIHRARIYILVEQERNRRVSIISRIDARSILALFSYFVLPAYPLPLFPNDKLKIRRRERSYIEEKRCYIEFRDRFRRGILFKYPDGGNRVISTRLCHLSLMQCSVPLYTHNAPRYLFSRFARPLPSPLI